MNQKIILVEKLTKLADKLDNVGYTLFADRIDALIKSSFHEGDDFDLTPGDFDFDTGDLKSGDNDKWFLFYYYRTPWEGIVYVPDHPKYSEVLNYDGGPYSLSEGKMALQKRLKEFLLGATDGIKEEYPEIQKTDDQVVMIFDRREEREDQDEWGLAVLKLFKSKSLEEINEEKILQTFRDIPDPEFAQSS